jgi:hypothetical protein
LWSSGNHNAPIVTRYVGHTVISAKNGPQALPSLPAALSNSVLNAMGTKGWAQYKPSKAQAGFTQAIGELHELPTLPKLNALKEAMKNLTKRNAKNAAKSVGGNYLNVEFGWVPLVSDAINLLKAVKNFQSNLDKLRRNQGRPIRRGGPVGSDSNTTTSVTTTGNGNPGINVSFGAGNYSGQWTKTVVTQSTTNYRFSGRFRFFIDFDKAMKGDIFAAGQITRILFGVDPLYAAYQLMPWSWLLDWFSSTGAVLDNLLHDGADDLVADYAYINGKTTTIVQTFITQYLNDGSGAKSYSWYQEDITTVFRRIKASPFGFGLLIPNLSLRQKAILAALGLTRLG